jgi:hypothetical protein
VKTVQVHNPLLARESTAAATMEWWSVNGLVAVSLVEYFSELASGTPKNWQMAWVTQKVGS